MVIIIIVWVLLALFILFPLYKVVQQSLAYNGHFSFEVYKRIFSKIYFLTPLLNSLKLGVLVGAIGTLIAYLFAYIVTRTDIRGKEIIRTIVNIPTISPPFVMALATILLFGTNGIISNHILHKDINVFGFGGLLFTEVFAYASTGFLALVGVLESIDPSLEEAALDMGASKSKVFWTVTLPLSTPGILASFLLIFTQSMADFGNPMVIAGRFQVLSVQAYLEITGAYDLSGGAGLAIMLLLPTLIAFAVQKYWLSRRSYITVTGKPSSMELKRTSRQSKLILGILAGLYMGLIFLMYGTVLWGSFVKLWGVNNTLTLDNYRFVFDTSWSYVKDTLILAAIATPIAGFFGVFIAYLVSRREFVSRRLLEATSLINFAVPGTVVGIGYIFAFNTKPLILTGTALIIILVFVFRRMPVGIQSATAALQQIDPAIDEAAIDLGANTLRTFWSISLPLIKPALFAGLFYTLTRCVTAISAVIFVVSGKWNLITVAMLSSIQNSDLAQAAAFSMVIIAIVLVGMLFLRLLTRKEKLARVT